jgi:hypothetical protein
MGAKASVEQCHGEIFGGKFNFSSEIDLVKKQLEYLEMELKNLSVKEIYKVYGGNSGKLTGYLNGSLRLEKSAMQIDSIHGSGKIDIRNLSATDLPLQKQLLVLLFMNRLSHLKFTRIDSELKIKKHQIVVTELTGQGDPLSFQAKGSIKFNGYFKQDVSAHLSKDLAGDMPRTLNNILLSAKDGGLLFNCTAFGAFNKPSIKLDERIRNRAIGEIIRNTAELINFLR